MSHYGVHAVPHIDVYQLPAPQAPSNPFDRKRSDARRVDDLDELVGAAVNELGAELDGVRKPIVVHSENAPADSGASLEHPGANALILKQSHRRQSGDARADNHYIYRTILQSRWSRHLVLRLRMGQKIIFRA